MGRGVGMHSLTMSAMGVNENAQARGSVVLPAYNEGSVIAESITAVSKVLLDHLSRYTWEIVVVDDGSVDETAQEVEAVAQRVEVDVRLIRHRQNAGLGGALRTAFRAVRGDVIVILDCDLSYAPSTAVELVETWEATGAHVVIASPYMPGGHTIEVPAALERRSRIANRIISASALDNLHTFTGLVKAYDGAFLRKLSLKAVDVDINVEILYKVQLLRGSIVEIPATLNWSGLQARASRSRLISRRSRWNTAKSLVMTYLFRPFWFPLAPALLLLAGGVALLALGDVDLSGLGVIALVVSAQYMAAALAMLQAKRYFEELFTQTHGLRAISVQPPSMTPAEEVRLSPPPASGGRFDGRSGS